jgi:CRP-like cAMP-binding protein
LTEVELCLLPRQKVWELFGKMPDSPSMSPGSVRAKRAIVDENPLSAGRRSAAQRIAALIVTLYKRADALAMVTDGTFAFPLSQQHIADALGLSLVHTNKTLARLRRMGMYTQTNGSLTLTNPRVLGRIAQHFDAELARRPLI